MKNKNFFKLVFILLTTAFLAISTSSFAQLNGNYTINPRSAASSTNYRNWASAVGDLLSGSRTDGGSASGPGINAAVTFTAYDSIYDNTAIELTAVSGASYTNRITFKSAGGDSTKCMLRTSSSSSTTNDYVLSLNGCDYITFQEIGFERTGANTNFNVVVISNDADNNKLIRCFLKGKKSPSSSSLGFAYGPTSIVYFTGNGDSTELNQNVIMYGYNGVFSQSASTAVKIIGNRIDTSGSSGIYMTGQNALEILGNSINMGDFGPGKGHYTSYGFRIETSPSLLAASNKIVMSATNGQVVRAIVIASVTSPSSAPAMVYNNSIVNGGGTTECTGFAVYGTYYLNIMYNNVLINNSLTNASAYYHYAAYANSNIRILNNNLVNRGGGYAINVPGSNTADIDSLNYNNYYSNGNYLGNWNATNYTTFSSWQSGTGRDANSLNYDPGYASTTDLHISNIGLNGKANLDSRVRKDIDGETRDNSSPDIGSDEFFPVNLDAGVANLDSPLLFSPGKQMVKVTFQNYGFDTIKNVEIHWSINGSTQTPYSWSGKLDPGNSSSSTALGFYTFSANTNYLFKIWTKDPNKKADEKYSNDTLKISRLPAMAGNYKIGDTSAANYKSFNQAITAMTSRGIAGAINFTVFKGTYNEQITLVALPGMGASNPITFQNVSNDSSKVLVTLPATTATGSNNAVLQLRGANYVTFKGITFERTGATTNIGHVIHILNGAHHNTFTNGQMIGLFLTTANTQAYNILSDQTVDSFNTFKNNNIRYGLMAFSYVGTAAQHEKGTVIEGNLIANSYNNSLQIAYNDNLTIKGNRFSNVITHIIGNYDAQLYDCDNLINVNGNYFMSANTDTSLFLFGCNGTASNNGIIANNFVLRNYGKAFLLDGVDYQNVAFNTMYFNSSATTNQAITTTAAATTYLVMKNNNIVMDGGEAFHIATATQVNASDNNNLWVKGGALAYWGGTSYNTVSILSNNTGMDKKSMSVNPLFLSSNDLHIKNYQLKQKGTPVSGITTDIDGEIRNTTTPDIGGDEFKLTPNDVGMVRISKPAAGVCAGILDVEVVIRNFGSDVLKSSVINWTINGNIQTPYSWSGSLNSLDSVKVTLGSFNFASSFNPKFIVKATLPNGKKDEINFNDSIIVTRALRALPNVNLGVDQVICAGDSALIGVGFVTGHTYKWTNLSNTVISTNSEIYVKPTSKTKYILEAINTAFTCTNRDTIEVDVITKPVADAGIDVSICPNASVQIGAAPQSGFTYSWTSFPKGFTSNSANPTVSPTQTTIYYLDKSVSSSGCSDQDTIMVTVVALPTPKIVGKDLLCNKDIQNYFTTNNAGNTYKWTIQKGKILSGNNTNSIIVQWDTIGVGALQVVETNASACSEISQYFININPNPTSSFSYNGSCLTNITTFKNESANAQTYAWTFGDGSTSTLKDPSHSYGQAISYNVRLISKNSYGCNDTFISLVSIEPLPSPNFTTVQKPGNTIDFTNASTISSGSIASYHWRFGDGDTSIIENPSHKYNSSANTSVTLCVKSAAGCESCTTKVVGFIGIKNQLVNRNIDIYPNPSHGTYTINSEKIIGKLQILNQYGQVIQDLNINNNKYPLDLTNESNGVYFLRVIFDNGEMVLRLIKN